MININAREVFRKNLSKYMGIRNVTQTDITAAIGVTPSTLSDWVLGKKYPRVDAMQKLADYFGIPMSSLTANDWDEQGSMSEDEERLLIAYRNADEQSRTYVLDILLAHPRDKSDPYASIRASIEEIEREDQDTDQRRA